MEAEIDFCWSDLTVNRAARISGIREFFRIDNEIKYNFKRCTARIRNVSFLKHFYTQQKTSHF
jgi:hypothetical protein